MQNSYPALKGLEDSPDHKLCVLAQVKLALSLPTPKVEHEFQKEDNEEGF